MDIIPEGISLNESENLRNLRIDPLAEIEVPPTFLTIDDAPVMTAGNFSMIVGKAKSKKTFFLVGLVASLLKGELTLDKIKGVLPNDKKNVLYFDTEQSRYHAHRTIKRICKLTGNDNPENLQAYNLRPLPPAERLEEIQNKIYATESLGIVIIDGLRDLLSIGINDEEEATKLTSYLLKWTYELQIHICLVLHQNKNDNNARGHIGTEAINKAETTISITKHLKDNNVSLVACEYSRDKDFEEFAFTIEDGLPINCDAPEGEGQTRSANPQKLPDQQHWDVLNHIYRERPDLKFTELRDAIMYGFDNSFGQNKCREYIYHYEQKEWIAKEREGKNVFYRYKRAIF